MKDELARIPFTMCVVKATVIAGTTTTISNTGSIHFCIRGKAYLKTAMTAAAVPTTDAALGTAFLPVPVNKACVFVIGLDAALAVKVCQGEIVDWDGTNFGRAPQFPGVPDTICPIAYLLTKVGATGAAWTFGVSNLAGPPTGVVHTFVDLMGLPDRPQVS